MTNKKIIVPDFYGWLFLTDKNNLPYSINTGACYIAGELAELYEAKKQDKEANIMRKLWNNFNYQKSISINEPIYEPIYEPIEKKENIKFGDVFNEYMENENLSSFIEVGFSKIRFSDIEIKHELNIICFLIYQKIITILKKNNLTNLSFCIDRVENWNRVSRYEMQSSLVQNLNDLFKIVKDLPEEMSVKSLINIMIDLQILINFDYELIKLDLNQNELSSEFKIFFNILINDLQNKTNSFSFDAKVFQKYDELKNCFNGISNTLNEMQVKYKISNN